MTRRQQTDGDGWVACRCGDRHWGRFGAAGLMLVSPDGWVLLQHRADWSHFGGTWGIPGGARASDEPAATAALREAGEEAAVPADAVRTSHARVEDHGTWSYTTVIAHAADRIDAHPSDPESHDIRWVRFEEVTDRALHPGFAASWPELRERALRRVLLVVDAANVVGSRPDGWWRDRAAAAARLRDELAALAERGIPADRLGLPGQTWWPDIHLVVEGQARGVRAAGRLSVHAASGEGDALLVATVQQARTERPDDHVIAVTADRALRARVESTGASVLGPRKLLDLLG